MESNEQISYTRNTDKVFEVFQSLRNDDFLCDVILKTDNGYTVNAHKVVLAAACPYFLAMFSHFKEREKKHIIIKELDPTALKILINYMYTGQILVTEENVQILLAGSTLLQLHCIQEVCCDLLKRILHPTNCSDIWTLADLYSCQEFLPICESYIKQHFSEMVKSDEFLSLSFDQFFKLISSDELTILSEEIVLKCVVKWVNNLPNSRKDVLPKLIAQIRFSLVPKECLLEALEEPIIKNSPECQGLINEALHICSKDSQLVLKDIHGKRRRVLHMERKIREPIVWDFPTNSPLFLRLLNMFNVMISENTNFRYPIALSLPRMDYLMPTVLQARRRRNENMSIYRRCLEIFYWYKLFSFYYMLYVWHMI